MNQNQTTYGVDIVFCMDCSGSMYDIIDAVKEHALNFHEILTEALEQEGKHIDKLRVKFIVFTGYHDEPTFFISDFMHLPQQSGEMKAFLDSTRLTGGDEEAGLEALALAIQSPWDSSCTKHRHIIVLYTDEPPHELGSGKAPGVSAQIPTSLEELKAAWDRMDRSSKRLALITTPHQPWPLIGTWENAMYNPMVEDNDFLSMDGIIKVLVNSIQ